MRWAPRAEARATRDEATRVAQIEADPLVRYELELRSWPTAVQRRGLDLTVLVEGEEDKRITRARRHKHAVTAGDWPRVWRTGRRSVSTLRHLDHSRMHVDSYLTPGWFLLRL